MSSTPDSQGRRVYMAADLRSGNNSHVLSWRAREGRDSPLAISPRLGFTRLSDAVKFALLHEDIDLINNYDLVVFVKEALCDVIAENLDPDLAVQLVALAVTGIDSVYGCRIDESDFTERHRLDFRRFVREWCGDIYRRRWTWGLLAPQGAGVVAVEEIRAEVKRQRKIAAGKGADYDPRPRCLGLPTARPLAGLDAEGD